MKLSPQIFGKVLNSLESRSGRSLGSEKRVFTRIKLETQLTMASLAGGEVTECYTALTRDISCGGVGMLQHLKMGPGDKLLVSLPCDKQEVNLICIVMFSRAVAAGVWLIGAQFTDAAGPALVEQFHKASAGGILSGALAGKAAAGQSAANRSAAMVN